MIINVPVNKSLLTGTLIIIFKKISLVTPDSYSLAKINDRLRYTFFSPSLISVRSFPPPKNEWKSVPRYEDMDPCPHFLSSYSPKGRGLLGGKVGIIVQQRNGMSRLSAHQELKLGYGYSYNHICVLNVCRSGQG